VPGLSLKVKESQIRRRLLSRVLNRGHAMPWDYQPLDDAASSYYRNTLAFDTDRLLALALEHGIIRLDDGRYVYDEAEIGRSQADARSFLANDSDIANALVRQIEEGRGFLR
jgi:hypothetical protein